MATGGVWPDLTCSAPAGGNWPAARVGRVRKDRIEQESIDSTSACAMAFWLLAEAEPDRIHVIDGSADIDAVHQSIRRAVEAALAPGTTHGFQGAARTATTTLRAAFAGIAMSFSDIKDQEMPLPPAQYPQAEPGAQRPAFWGPGCGQANHRPGAGQGHQLQGGRL